MFDRTLLRPGDVLLYRSSGLIPFMVRVKTWSLVDHTETYIGHGLSVAARFEGVGTYPFREEGLVYVLRPNVPFDFSAGMHWHLTSAQGQPYDTFGLFRSFHTEGRGNIGAQWCSEHSARFAKKSGYNPFGPIYDCEKVSPSMFLATPVYDVVWEAN